MIALSETVTLEMIYHEILALRRKVESLEKRMIPGEELDEVEFEEIKTLRAESIIDHGIPWEQVKAKLEGQYK